MNLYFVIAWVSWVIYFICDLRMSQIIERRICLLEESNRRLWAANQSLVNCVLDLHPGEIYVDDKRGEGDVL